MVARRTIAAAAAAAVLCTGLAVGAAGAPAGAANPVVVIDPGHDARANSDLEPIGPGSSDLKVKDGGGATGVVTGQREPVFNLAVALRLRTLLEWAGVQVVMTRTRTAGVSIGNVARARIANRATHGTHTLIPARRRGWTDDIYGASKRAGRIVQSSLVNRIGSVDRGLDERSDITGFNWSNVPAILVESGFLSNPAEDRLLASASYRRKIARGLCEGTLRFLGLPVRCA